jgi:hypothetical protein
MKYAFESNCGLEQWLAGKTALNRCANLLLCTLKVVDSLSTLWLDN